MALDLQYNLENFALWFQGGIRRWVLIFVGICVVLLAPMYFLGILLSNTWNTFGGNPNRYDDRQILTKKSIPEQDWVISKTQVVPLATGENVLYVSISNKANPLIGYFPFVYDIQILDKDGKALFNETQENYILPGTIRYLVVKSSNPQAAEVRLVRNTKTQPIYYNPNSKTIREADVRLINQNLRDITFTRDLEISATLKNFDRRQIKVLDILYILRDSRQSVVGIGTVQLTNLKPGEESSFKFLYPKPAERIATILDLQWTVNYLDEDNLFLP
jgi:hypothetical protein